MSVQNCMSAYPIVIDNSGWTSVADLVTEVTIYRVMQLAWLKLVWTSRLISN